jgi:hypothetical protein
MSILGQFVVYGLYGLYAVCSIVFLVEFWRKMYPPLKDALDSPMGSLLVLGFKGLAGLLAYILARAWLMQLTQVDPANFPRALVTFTAFALLISYPMLVTAGAMLMAFIYIFADMLLDWVWQPIQGFRKRRGYSPQPKPAVFALGHIRSMVYVFGPVGLFAFVALLIMSLYSYPFNRFFHKAGSVLLVLTEFSYDKTCAASSKTRGVALLKDRKELKSSNVLIADVTTWLNIQFSVGHCE